MRDDDPLKTSRRYEYLWGVMARNFCINYSTRIWILKWIRLQMESVESRRKNFVKKQIYNYCHLDTCRVTRWVEGFCRFFVCSRFKLFSLRRILMQLGCVKKQRGFKLPRILWLKISMKTRSLRRIYQIQ